MNELPKRLLNLIVSILNFLPQVGQFGTVTTMAAPYITSICGVTPRSLVTTAKNVDDIICQIAILLGGVRDLFRCYNWYPLYEVTTYDAICYSGTNGFAWVASTQFVIVFMTMVILTLRVTFYELPTIGEMVNTKEGDDMQPEIVNELPFKEYKSTEYDVKGDQNPTESKDISSRQS